MFSQVGMMPTRLTGAPIVAIARHVEFHLVHAGGLLQRDAAGVEGDALADQRDRRRPFPAAGILEHDEARRLLRPARHRQEGAHAEAPDFALVEHARAHRHVLLRKSARRFGEIARRADVRGQVGQVLRARGSGRDAASIAQAALGRGEVGVRDDDPEARELRPRRLACRLEVGDAVEGVADALDCVTHGVVRVEAGDRVGSQPGHGILGAAARQPLRRSKNGAAVGLAPVVAFRPEAHEQDAIGAAAA
jgi:hypothetical protein